MGGFFNQSHFLGQLNQISVHESVRRDIPVFPSMCMDEAGLPLTGSTTPVIAALETNAFGISWAAANVDALNIVFPVPGDFNQTAYDANNMYFGDTLQVVLLAQMAGSTDTPTITGTLYRKRAGAALSAVVNGTASAALSATSAMVYVTFRNAGIRANDVLTIKIVPGAHGTDALNVYGIWLRIGSVLVLYDETLRGGA